MRRMIEKGEAAVEAASDQNGDHLAGMSNEEATPNGAVRRECER